MVIRCFDFLPPLLFFVFSDRPFSGKALKISPSSSRFNMFNGLESSYNSVNHSIQACVVVVETSSASPYNLFSLTSYVCFQLSNHPFEAIKPANSSLSSLLLISIALLEEGACQDILLHSCTFHTNCTKFH